MSDRKIAVSVIEDNKNVQDGMEFIINSHSEFYCLQYLSAEEALIEVKRTKPDLVIMDIGLPKMDGITCTKILRQSFPNMPIMICTVFEDAEKIFNALKAGANGYILKKHAGESLIQSIKDLLNGGSPMSSQIARKVVDSFKAPINYKVREDFNLTNREREILSYIGKGLTNKEIAKKLFISSNTIRTHIYHIYEKLHVSNRVEAVKKLNNI
jgi:DNA-binding NarL/FixJ family response regulator